VAEAVRILVVGQTPPPFGGQAVMIQKLLEGKYPGFELIHVRMGFSREMDEIGRFRFGKLLELAALLGRSFRAWLRYRPPILYYPPAGPNLVPFLRDVVFLTLSRPWFKATIFHFHASGVSELYPKLNRLLQGAFWLAYRRPELAIRSAASAPDDGSFMNATRNVVLPLGLEDHGQHLTPRASGGHPPVILFVGVLKRTKGVMVLLDACRRLRDLGKPFRLVVVGKYESPDFASEVQGFVRTNGLTEAVAFPGVLVGADKWRAYEQADLFCFPSFFEAESFGLVLVEAMMFRLPIVATRWRGIPALVNDGDNGFLVETENPAETAAKLALLCDHPALREELGGRGRERYLEEFSKEIFEARMNEAFKLAASMI